jgi:hypothetical protein
LEGCPEVEKKINIVRCTNVKNLRGLIGVNSDLELVASHSGLTSLEGCPRKLWKLNIVGTKISSFEGFPDYIEDCLTISLFDGCLMFLHERFHDQKAIKTCYFYIHHNNEHKSELGRAFSSISDPFEFQDWCINNRLRGVLMKLQQLFEAENELGFDEIIE